MMQPAPRAIAESELFSLMFKKLLQSLSRSQSSAPAATAKPPAPKSGPMPPSKASGILNRIVKGEAAAAAPGTPEQLCEITPKMSRDEINERLKLLYRRYNRCASSLDAKLKAEAERMLDAIVEVREKHFGAI